LWIVKALKARRQASGGYDAGKQIKGRKRFLTVDTLGLILRVYVMAASGEREGANKFSNEFTGGNAVSRLHTIWVDGGLMVNPLCSG